MTSWRRSRPPRRPVPPTRSSSPLTERSQQMAWDFETDPEYQKVLDWADDFVREEIEPLDLAFPDQQYIPLDDNRRKVIDPLKDEVKRRGLWGTHLGPELGGQGYGQLKLALL